MSLTIETFESPLLSKGPTSVHGKPVRLELAVEHNRNNKKIEFTLEQQRHLPGEHGRNFFIYDGVTYLSPQAVVAPEVRKCNSLSVRAFLNGLQSKFEVLSFSLSTVQLRYGLGVYRDEVERVFAEACASALGIEENAQVRIQRLS